MHGEINVVLGLLLLHIAFGHIPEEHKWVNLLAAIVGFVLFVLGVVDSCSNAISIFRGG